MKRKAVIKEITLKKKKPVARGYFHWTHFTYVSRKPRSSEVKIRIIKKD